MKRAERLFIAALTSAALTGPIAAGCGASKGAASDPQVGQSAAGEQAQPRRLPYELGGPPPPAPAQSATDRGQGDPANGPKLKVSDVLGIGDRIAAMASVGLSQRTLLAWTTYAQTPVSDPTGRSSKHKRAPEPTSAKVLVRFLDRALDPVGPASAITTSAASVGGAAAAPGRPGREEACVAWIEADATSTQIGFAILTSAGKVLARRVQTGGKIHASDVALARVDDGWVVAWIDQRDGAPQVYATRVGEDVKPFGSERRLSHTTGEPSDLQLVARGSQVVAVWQTLNKDNAELYSAAIEASDLKAAPEVRVGSTTGAIQGVRLAPMGNRLVLGWVETPAVIPADAKAARHARPVQPPSVAKLTTLDWGGQSMGATHTVGNSDGSKSLAVNCVEGACRIAIARAQAATASQELTGLTWDASAAPRSAVPLLAIPDVAPEDMSPVFAQDAVIFAEDTLRGQGRVRKALVDW